MIASISAPIMNSTPSTVVARVRNGCAGAGTERRLAPAAAERTGHPAALMLGLMWVRARFGDNPCVESLLLVSWLLPFLFSHRYTDLKGRSGRVQALLIAVRRRS
jgi:hypothetical protein